MENLSEEIKIALKTKNTPRLNSLRYIKSLLQGNSKHSNPKRDIEVLLSYKKSLDNSLEIYKDYPIKLEEIKFDISVVCEFLPQPLTEDEVKQIIKELRERNLITDFSVLMKLTSAHLKGRFDGKALVDLVKQEFK